MESLPVVNPLAENRSEVNHPVENHSEVKEVVAAGRADILCHHRINPLAKDRAWVAAAAAASLRR